MGETQETQLIHQNVQSRYLKISSPIKDKRVYWGLWFGTSKMRKTSDTEMKKGMLGK